MLIIRTTKRNIITFCCLEMYLAICSEVIPRVRLRQGADRSGRVYPFVNDSQIKFCPYCGERIRTIIRLKSGKVVKVSESED